MSFSFSAEAATKAELKQKVAAELDTVVAREPVHAKDRTAGEAAASSFIDLLNEPAEGHLIRIWVNGSIGTVDDQVSVIGFGFSAMNNVCAIES